MGHLETGAAHLYRATAASTTTLAVTAPSIPLFLTRKCKTTGTHGTHGSAFRPAPGNGTATTDQKPISLMNWGQIS